MGKKRHSVETIVSKLREAEILLGKGQSLAEVLRGLGISDATVTLQNLLDQNPFENKR